MANLRVRPHAPAADGSVLEVTPQSAGWDHVGFKVVRLVDGQTHEGGEAGREACLVVVAGTADITAGEAAFEAVGGRVTPFEDRAPGRASTSSRRVRPWAWSPGSPRSTSPP